LADGMGLGMKLCWTGGEAGAFDWLLKWDWQTTTEPKRKRNIGRDSSAAVGRKSPIEG
jgi:hypothetical protein